MAPVLILIDVVLIPLMLVVLGLGLVVRCQVQRLQRWPGVRVNHHCWPVLLIHPQPRALFASVDPPPGRAEQINLPGTAGRSQRSLRARRNCAHATLPMPTTNEPPTNDAVPL